MLKKFTTTFYMNLFHNINSAPFRIKTNQKVKPRREEKNETNCDAPLKEHTQAQENWYLILILK